MPIDGDEDRVVQVLANLLTNAAKYTPQHGQISLSAHAEGGTAVIACEDDGPGIPEEKLKQVFDPFYTTKAEGMGMGLSITRTIVEAHHGQILVRNQPDGGASFQIRLPLR